jgi:hypothetical protein
MKVCANPLCGKEHKRPKYCSEECYLKANRAQRKSNIKRYLKKYKGIYREAYKPSPKPERTMCKCPSGISPLCEKEFLGSPWQGPYSNCDACASMLRGISFEPYQIGSGERRGYKEEASL